METKILEDGMETKTIAIAEPLDPGEWEKKQRARAQRYAEYLQRREESRDGFEAE